MTFLDYLCALLIACCLAFMAYQVGHANGRKLGYEVCVAEEDEDYPRSYSGRALPEERL